MSEFELALESALYLWRRALCRIAAIIERGRGMHAPDDRLSDPVAEHSDHARRHLAALAAERGGTTLSGYPAVDGANKVRYSAGIENLGGGEH